MLIKYEFRKYLTSFHVILIVVLLILNIGTVIYQYHEMFRVEYEEICGMRQKMVDLYLTNPDEYERLYEEHQNSLASVDSQYYSASYESNSKAIVVYDNKFIDLPTYGDQELFREVEAIIHAQDTYSANLSSLLRDSILRLKEIEDSPDSYLYKYYRALCLYYGKLTEMEFDVFQIYGWNEFFSSKTSVIFIALVLAGTLCNTFTNDHSVGMTNILHISKRGRGALLRSKVLLIVIVSSVLSLIFSIIPLIVLWGACGVSEMNIPLQMLDEFRNCPYQFTIGQYLIVFLAFRVVFFSTFSLLIAITAMYFESEKFAISMSIVCMISGIFLSEIPSNSNLYFLRKCSFFELANVHIMFERYTGLNLLGECINYTWFVSLCLLLFAGGCILFTFLYPFKFEELHKESYHDKNFSTVTTSLFTNEGYKQLICGKYIWFLICVLILQCIVLNIYYRPMKNETEQLYWDYISQVRGEITDNKLRMIETEDDYIKTTLGEYEAKTIAYRNGELSKEEYQAYQNRYRYAEYSKLACEYLVERKNYLLGVSNIEPHVEFLYEEGIVKYLEFFPDILSIFSIICLGSFVFSQEYETNFSKIMRATKKGRKDIFFTKILYTSTLVIILYLLLQAIEWGIIYRYYKIDYLTAPLISIPEFAESSLKIRIIDYVLIDQAISLCGYFVLMYFCIGVSILMQSQIKAIITTSFLGMGAILSEYMGISMLPLFRFSDIVYSKNLYSNIILLVSCILLDVCVMIMAYKKWNVTGRRK